MIGVYINSLGTTIGGFFTTLGTRFTTLGTTIGDFFTTLGADIDTLFTTMSTTITDLFTTLKTAIGGFFTTIGDKIELLLDNMSTTITDLFTTLKTAISGFFTTLGTTIGGFFTALTTAFGNLLSLLGNTILDGIKAIFIPDSDNLNIKLSAIKDKFDFVSEISLMFKNIANLLVGNNSSPTFTIPFSNANSDFNYGHDVVINFNWYLPYKPAVDRIIVAFAYMFFVLNIFRHLPSIISGGSSTVVNIDKIERWHDD